MAAAATPDRFHALDAVRAAALLLGVLLHAAFSFFPGPRIWPVMDSRRSLLLAGLVFGLHVFRMITFFLLAGFFAHMSFHRCGLWGFLRDRAKRIALPLVVLVVMAVIVAISLWAATQANGGALPKAPRAPPLSLAFFLLAPLWFLYVLLLLYAAALILRGFVVLIDRKGDLRRGLDKVMGLVLGLWAPVLLAAPLTLAFLDQPNWIAWWGIPTPDSSLIPNVPALTGFGSAFALGWLLHREPARLEILRRRWLLNLALAVVFIGTSLALVGLQPAIAPIADPARRTAYAACYALAAWSATFAVIGVALRFLHGYSAPRRWIADSSYWLYIIHLPIVMALQVVVAHWPLPWPAKLGFILATGLGVMWASYQLLVRHSFIGWILNGPRPRRERPRPDAVRAATASASSLQTRDPWSKPGRAGATHEGRNPVHPRRPSLPARAGEG